MKPVSRANPATEENKNQERSNTMESGSSNQGNQNQGNQSRSQGRSESRGGGSELGGIGSTVSDFAERAQDVASNVLGKAQEYGSDALEQSGVFVRRYPAQTLLAGFGIGLVMGLAIGRR